ncbi:Panacea domain-containing protein [Luteolibacter sp. Populi]|uniref:Panacea domain-containing protein n=1 Tax=Luteolibacter sp. Populi TaxID=3230487 RepID=UPI003467D13A
MANASQVARYLLALQCEEAGDLVSNLKLQKLLYYCQGMHLALKDAPLFADDVEAWAHGPVVRRVYGEYKEFGGNPIPCPEGEPDDLTEEERNLVEEVYQEFGQFSAWKLREMTHDELPYKEAEATGSKLVNTETMRRFFKAYLTA